jgi:hypothetical protein
MKPQKFQDAFFSRSMHQHFNRAVGTGDFTEEAPVRRYLRNANQL